MTSLLDEYGRMVIMVLGVIMFLTIISKLNSNYEHIYNTDVVTVDVYSGDVSSYSEDGSNVKNLFYSPHFTASDNISLYKISGTTFSYEDAMKIVDVYTDDTSTLPYIDGDMIASYKSSLDPDTKAKASAVHIYVYRYDLEMKTTDDAGNTLANPVAVYEYVDATDKYGNYIYETDAAGNKVRQQRRQLKYNETDSFELTLDGDSIDINKKSDGTDVSSSSSSIPPRYKLVYRFEYNNKKAEYTTLIIKDNN
jgi:hypothetical protein